MTTRIRQFAFTSMDTLHILKELVVFREVKQLADLLMDVWASFIHLGVIWVSAAVYYTIE